MKSKKHITMFSEELNKLIEAAFVDGVLTDKERSVILKRAVAEGEDPDEVDIFLNAEVQKRAKSANQFNNAVKADATVILQQLSDIIGEINAKYENKEPSKYEEKRKKEIAHAILSIHVPSSKEELLDFIPSLEAKWLNTSISEHEIKIAYKNKYKEAYAKAESLFRNDTAFKTIFEKEKTYKKCFNLARLSILQILGLIFLCLFIFLFIVALATSGDEGTGREVNRSYSCYQDAARAHDYEAAHRILDKMLEDYHNKEVTPYSDSWFSSNKRHKKELQEKKEMLVAYQEGVDYVYNSEILFLCSLGDKQSIERIAFLLSEIKMEGMPIPEGTKYDYNYDKDKHNAYTESILKFNKMCDMVVEMAITKHSIILAERIIPLYKDVPNKPRYGDVINYSSMPKENAINKINKAIDDGVFPNIDEHI